MNNRRDLLIGSLAIGALSVLPSVAFAAPDSFEDLLRQAETDPTLIYDARAANEGRSSVYIEYNVTQGPRLRTPPSSRPISSDAIRLLIGFEVSSAAHYQAALQGAVLPAPPSGLTIGMGYDLGYVTETWLREDWGAWLSPAQLAVLAKACRKTGAKAKPVKPLLKDIRIPWAQAEPQFRTVVLPRYVGETLKHLPVDDDLPPDCLGALVSLVYNRGASFGASGPRYAEMRAIKRHVQTGQIDRIPAEFEAMTRLWTTPKTRGVKLRRMAEAALFRKGLAAHG